MRKRLKPTRIPYYNPLKPGLFSTPLQGTFRTTLLECGRRYTFLFGAPVLGLPVSGIRRHQLKVYNLCLQARRQR